MLFAPLKGGDIKVTDRHTKVVWAECLSKRVDMYFTKKKIILFIDDLNTHKLSSLYTAFEAAQACRIA
jgi:hypothetical protein